MPLILARPTGRSRAGTCGRRSVVTYGEPAGTLSHPASLATAGKALSLAGLQVVEALLALGDRASEENVRNLLAGGPGEDHDLAVAGVLAELRRLALVWPGRAVRTLGRRPRSRKLVGAAIYAWCELRDDERVFTVARILSVVPVG